MYSVKSVKEELPECHVMFSGLIFGAIYSTDTQCLPSPS